MKGKTAPFHGIRFWKTDFNHIVRIGVFIHGTY